MNTEHPQRLRLVLMALTRSMVSVLLVFLAYSVVPIGSIHGGRLVFRLALSVVFFIVVVVWQVRAVLASDRPATRAVEAVVSAVAVLIVVFAFVYVSMSVSNPASFSEPLDRPAGVYFTTTVLSTVGFGDIHPVSTSARMILTVQMLFNLVALGVIVRVMASAVREGLARRDGTPGADGAERPQ